MIAELGPRFGASSLNLLGVLPGVFFCVIFTRFQVPRVNILFLLYFTFRNQKCCKPPFLFFFYECHARNS